jgi:hypothetical protein
MVSHNNLRTYHVCLYLMPRVASTCMVLSKPRDPNSALRLAKGRYTEGPRASCFLQWTNCLSYSVRFL